MSTIARIYPESILNFDIDTTKIQIYNPNINARKIEYNTNIIDASVFNLVHYFDNIYSEINAGDFSSGTLPYIDSSMANKTDYINNLLTLEYNDIIERDNYVNVYNKIYFEQNGFYTKGKGDQDYKVSTYKPYLDKEYNRLVALSTSSDNDKIIDTENKTLKFAYYLVYKEKNHENAPYFFFYNYYFTTSTTAPTYAEIKSYTGDNYNIKYDINLDGKVNDDDLVSLLNSNTLPILEMLKTNGHYKAVFKIKYVPNINVYLLPGVISSNSEIRIPIPYYHDTNIYPSNPLKIKIFFHITVEGKSISDVDSSLINYFRTTFNRFYENSKKLFSSYSGKLIKDDCEIYTKTDKSNLWYYAIACYAPVNLSKIIFDQYITLNSKRFNAAILPIYGLNTIKLNGDPEGFSMYIYNPTSESYITLTFIGGFSKNTAASQSLYTLTDTLLNENNDEYHYFLADDLNYTAQTTFTVTIEVKIICYNNVSIKNVVNDFSTITNNDTTTIAVWISNDNAVSSLYFDRGFYYGWNSTTDESGKNQILTNTYFITSNNGQTINLLSFTINAKGYDLNNNNTVSSNAIPNGVYTVSTNIEAALSLTYYVKSSSTSTSAYLSTHYIIININTDKLDHKTGTTEYSIEYSDSNTLLLKSYTFYNTEDNTVVDNGPDTYFTLGKDKNNAYEYSSSYKQLSSLVLKDFQPGTYYINYYFKDPETKTDDTTVYTDVIAQTLPSIEIKKNLTNNKFSITYNSITILSSTNKETTNITMLYYITNNIIFNFSSEKLSTGEIDVGIKINDKGETDINAYNIKENIDTKSFTFTINGYDKDNIINYFNLEFSTKQNNYNALHFILANITMKFVENSIDVYIVTGAASDYIVCTNYKFNNGNLTTNTIGYNPDNYDINKENNYAIAKLKGKVNSEEKNIKYMSDISILTKDNIDDYGFEVIPDSAKVEINGYVFKNTDARTFNNENCLAYPGSETTNATSISILNDDNNNNYNNITVYDVEYGGIKLSIYYKQYTLTK